MKDDLGCVRCGKKITVQQVKTNRGLCGQCMRKGLKALGKAVQGLKCRRCGKKITVKQNKENRGLCDKCMRLEIMETWNVR